MYKTKLQRTKLSLIHNISTSRIIMKENIVNVIKHENWIEYKINIIFKIFQDTW